MRSKETETDSPYSQVLKQMGAVNAVFPEASRKQMADMVDQIARTDRNLAGILGTEQGIPIKAGFATEELHAESFNLESILQDKGARALTDRYRDDWHALGLRGHDQARDIIVTDGHGRVIHSAQVKVYKDAESTANAFREMRDGQPHYMNSDSMIGPSDQVAPTDGSMSIADHARKTELRNLETRPDVSEAAKQVQEKVTSHLDVDGVQSRSLSRDEATAVAKGDDSIREAYQSDLMTKATLQQMKRAAIAGAVTTAIVAGVANTIHYLKLVKQGKLSGDEAVFRIIKSTAVASADTALKAGAATGAVSVTVRALASQSFQGLLKRNAVAGAAICGVDLIQCLVKVAAGKMTMAQLEERTGKNIFQTAAGVTGSALGMGLLTGTSVAFAPFVGALAGGLIAGQAMNIAIQNHIEKPFKEVIANTEALLECEKGMHTTVQSFLIGQQAFEAFVKEESKQDKRLAAVTQDIESAGTEMRKAIDRI